jgi:uncharacterized protein YhbP (UPF0306 family)
MPADDERHLLHEYVADGKLMQIATLSESGPTIAHVWYSHADASNRLCFISHKDRQHSQNLRANPAVGGGIVHVALEGLGQKVRGVTFRGSGTELAVADAGAPLDAFLERWPNARGAISLEQLSDDSTPMRLYEIAVTEWILFDEANFPENPRRVIQGG